VLQLYNGRAEIPFIATGNCTLGITADGLPSGFFNLPQPPKASHDRNVASPANNTKA
jgi:hypothetical protein